MDFVNELQLQPLRVTEGWRMDYNNGFYEIDVDPHLVPEDERWWIFKEDMLQMSHERFNRIIDIGFTPEGDFDEGAYNLVIHKGDFIHSRIDEFRTQDREKLITRIESWMAAVSSQKM